MADNVQTQIYQEAPDIQAAKLGLMGSAKSTVDAINQAALQGRFLNPDYKVAGMSPDQASAINLGRAGIGAYQPYMNAAAQGIAGGMGTTGQALDILKGADTRGQFGGAQAAMAASGQPISQMGDAANLIRQGVPLIGQGQTGMTEASQMAGRYAQADLGQAGGALGQGIQSLAGAAQGFSPTSIQQFMNPYQQQVIDESIRQINRQGDLSRQNLAAQAVRAGAFGGSREGAQRGELERGLSEQRNAAIVGGLSQGYQNAAQQAQQAFEAQQQRLMAQGQNLANIGNIYGQQALQNAQLGQSAAGLRGSLANQIANLSGMYGTLGSQQAGVLGQQAQLQQALGQGIGNLAAQQFGIGSQMAQGIGSLGAQQGALGMNAAQLGQAAQGMGQQDVNFLYNLGAQQQRQQQAVLDAARQNQLQQNMQPLQTMAYLSDIYKGAPSSQMAMSQTSQAAPSPFQQIAGLGIGAVSAGAAANKAGLFG